jgi:ATP-dependent HslUV protease ATP-binding subunit HslU
MIGATGVGKTEISRKMAKITNAPFIKVEATKFTEIGYVGRDVESIIRDLVEVTFKRIKSQQTKEFYSKALVKVKTKIAKILSGKDASQETIDVFKEKINSGELDNTQISIDVNTSSGGIGNGGFEMPGGAMMGISAVSIGEMMGISNKKKKKMKVKDAIRVLTEEKAEEMVDSDQLSRNVVRLVEQDGIVFIDEFDKIVTDANAGSGRRGDVSREGVQRDLLSLVEGTIVNTKYGMIKTDHILFIASGAFYDSKPSDMSPELQGRFPVRVEFDDLTEDDLRKIISDTDGNLIEQYTAMIGVEGVEIKFAKNAIEKIANIAFEVNKEIENIGARRLYTVFEKLLEDLSFEVCDKSFKKKEFNITAKYVEEKLGELTKKKKDLIKMIL